MSEQEIGVPTMTELVEDRDRLLKERDELRATVERERLRYGQQFARATKFMQAMSTLVRKGVITSDEAKAWIDKADAAARDVRIEDFGWASV